MGLTYVRCEIINPREPEQRTAVRNVLVDTGSEFTWIPAAVAVRAATAVAKEGLIFVMANGETVTRSTGYAIVRAEGFETIDEIVIAESSDLPLLGSRTLEGFGAVVDPRRKRLVAAGPHIAARAE